MAFRFSNTTKIPPPLASRRVMTRKALLAAAVAAAVSATLAGCGSSGRTATGGASTANWVTHSDPVKLLPKSGELTGVVRHVSASNRYDQALNATTVNPFFGAASSRVMHLASGAAELSLRNRSGTQLYTQLFVFKTLNAARSLTSAFLAGTRLSQGAKPATGGPGEQSRASRQTYDRRNISYRYAFREQNVLCLVELDGPRGKYPLSDVLTVAKLADRRISSTLSAGGG